MQCDRFGVRALMLLLAAGLAAFAVRADGAWVARHFFLLDSSLEPARFELLFFRAVPAVLAAALALAAFKLRPDARVAAAVLCALPASELLLRWLEAHKSEERRTLHARLGEPHPRYGWIFRPQTAPVVRLGGREFRLAFDADGSRIAAPGAAPNPSLPSLIVAGESVAMGHGLDWDDTFAAIAARDLGLQPVNLAVNGYGVDQAWLRLTDVLPRYTDVRAVVMVIMPVQLGRNLIDDHPRLTERFELLPAHQGGLRLRSLFVNQIPFHTDAAIAESVRLTRALLEDLACREPSTLFVAPGGDRGLARELFAGLRWIPGELGDADRFPGDGHPNPSGARKIALAVEAALRLCRPECASSRHAVRTAGPSARLRDH
ncbi:MAG TPA: SGNH/GDSL hydrolase family protein [Myxococcales bacterium]